MSSSSNVLTSSSSNVLMSSSSNLHISQTSNATFSSFQVRTSRLEYDGDQEHHNNGFNHVCGINSSYQFV